MPRKPHDKLMERQRSANVGIRRRRRSRMPRKPQKLRRLRSLHLTAASLVVSAARRGFVLKFKHPKLSTPGSPAAGFTGKFPEQAGLGPETCNLLKFQDQVSSLVVRNLKLQEVSGSSFQPFGPKLETSRSFRPTFSMFS
jgi:hypothetical protein